MTEGSFALAGDAFALAAYDAAWLGTLACRATNEKKFPELKAGFVNAAEASGPRAEVEVVFLIQDGRVAYKAMSGV